jgi:hypothetical protein
MIHRSFGPQTAKQEKIFWHRRSQRVTIFESHPMYLGRDIYEEILDPKTPLRKTTRFSKEAVTVNMERSSGSGMQSAGEASFSVLVDTR